MTLSPLTPIIIAFFLNSYASHDLIPKKKAVYSFPGLKKRLFPNFDVKHLNRYLS